MYCTSSPPEPVRPGVIFRSAALVCKARIYSAGFHGFIWYRDEEDPQPDHRRPDGRGRDPRATKGINYLAMVRAFYLDLAQWAIDEPARWGVWAAPCPVREGRAVQEEGPLRPQVTRGPTDPCAASCSAHVDPRCGHRTQARRRTTGGRASHQAGVPDHRGGTALAQIGHQEPGSQGLGGQPGNRSTTRPHPGGSPRILGLVDCGSLAPQGDSR